LLFAAHDQKRGWVGAKVQQRRSTRSFESASPYLQAESVARGYRAAAFLELRWIWRPEDLPPSVANQAWSAVEDSKVAAPWSVQNSEATDLSGQSATDSNTAMDSNTATGSSAALDSMRAVDLNAAVESSAALVERSAVLDWKAAVDSNTAVVDSNAALVDSNAAAVEWPPAVAASMGLLAVAVAVGDMVEAAVTASC
jgi:hypothetical protein